MLHSEWTLHLTDGTVAHIYLPAVSGQAVRRWYKDRFPKLRIAWVEQGESYELRCRGTAPCAGETGDGVLDAQEAGGLGS